MKYFYVSFLFFFTLTLFGQEKFSKEISLITDNDLYVSTKRDRYYTSGFFLNYRYLTDVSSDKIEKKIIELQLGQELYNPNKPNVKDLSEHDRPFAAYLYASYGVSRIYKKNRIFNTSLQVGVIGPNAFGKEVQNFIHDIYGFEEATGWQYQISNAIGLNFNAEYMHFLSKSKANGRDLTWINNVKIGTVFTNISSGFLVRFGFNELTNMLNSIAFGSHLNNQKNNSYRKVESFLFIKTMFRYTFYDATLQGSFLNNNSIITKELVPFVFDLAIGIKFTAKRLNFGYTFNYNTNKSKGLRFNYGNKYGSINLSYLLH
ncbi:MAG: lipid A deacylase LpxR family protein [Flavobacteriaceae bacterium]|nr:lipid A deacylase LpxR family protein [Flavobacteriaceae bacterium]